VKAYLGKRPKVVEKWLAAGLDDMVFRAPSVALEEGTDGSVSVFCSQRLENAKSGLGVSHLHRYTITAGAIIKVDNTFDVDQELVDLPRLGVELTLPLALRRVEWFGRGPHENYRDRDAGCTVGRYSADVDELHVPYIMPQECGNHSAVRWATLRGADGHGLRITAPEHMEFSASRLSGNDLFKALHTNELRPRELILVHLDYWQRGVGTATCGPDTLPQYRVGGGIHHFEYWLEPL